MTLTELRRKVRPVLCPLDCGFPLSAHCRTCPTCPNTPHMEHCPERKKPS